MGDQGHSLGYHPGRQWATTDLYRNFQTCLCRTFKPARDVRGDDDDDDDDDDDGGDAVNEDGLL
eukprot:12411636-Karenia_brevis.AAC.1